MDNREKITITSVMDQNVAKILERKGDTEKQRKFASFESSDLLRPHKNCTQKPERKEDLGIKK
ncbi:hypothetical protein NIES208_15100 [[Limnothrix rosea] IAM M-220]|nr:hypothetical protein NIES208_15100 [[Limnothrix rosea] IAM M-220]